MKLALAGFIIPYMFVYNQKLMLYDVGILDGTQVVITSCVGVTLIAAAVEGYLFGRLNILLRLVSFAGALLLIDSGLYTDIAGVACLVLIIVIQKLIAARNSSGQPQTMS